MSPKIKTIIPLNFYIGFVTQKIKKLKYFLITGHIKFSCDRHFGLAKKADRATDNIETFADALEVISSSANNQNTISIRDFSTNTQVMVVFDRKSFRRQGIVKFPQNSNYLLVNAFDLRILTQVSSIGKSMIVSPCLLKF